MPFRARLYIGSVITAGACILAEGIWNWRTEDIARFVSFCLVTMIASGLKVILPGVKSTISMNFLFVLIGVSQLAHAETLIMGCLGMLVQCVFFSKLKPNKLQVLFSLSSMAISINAAWVAYHLKIANLGSSIMLLFAAAIFFLINTFSVASVLALTEDKPILPVWRESYFWSFPNYLVGAGVAGVIVQSNLRFGWQVSLLLLPVIYFIYRSQMLYVGKLEGEKKHAEERRQHAEEVAALHRRTIRTLALAIEAKDQTTSDHLTRVEVYATQIGMDLGLGGNEMEALRAAALLHDIGKLAVPEYIISKPGKLTPDEFEKMKTHTVVGAEMVEQVRFPYPVAPIVRSHHEKWDGSGYPDGLTGENIPLGARILSAVDCLDALASDRQYRRALPLDQAIEIVRKESGKSFDPKIVDILSRRYLELESLARVALQSEKAKLSTDVRIERGAAPAAGFETIPEARDNTRDLVNFHRSIVAEERVEVLSALRRVLDGCASRESIYAAGREALEQALAYEAMAIYSRQGDRLIPVCLDGSSRALLGSNEIQVGSGLSGWVVENGKTILNGNPKVESGYVDIPAHGELNAALAVPLETQASGIQGVLSIYRREANSFTKAELERVEAIGVELARALECVRQGLN